MKEQDHLRWRRGDTLLVVCVLLTALLLLLGLFWLPARGAQVTVTVDGRTVATFALSTDTTYTIPGIGGYNILEIRDGEARVTDADCPDAVCVRHRAVSRVGQSILCLPHKVAVTVVGGEPAVDAEV
ncbi:MAG: NusG domain II-containing protein [Ruminococcaceae bacterium]|nr:NusG domain II-containing protein [Oscillospiraceae bacterium]